MRASVLILVAIFSNFFGSYIVSTYVRYIGIEERTAFMPTGYERSAIIECGLLFTVIIICYAVFLSINKGTIKKHEVYYYVADHYYHVLSLLMLVFAVISLFSVNWSFTIQSRGEGQFERTIFDSLSRITLLSFPVAIFYMNAYWRLLMTKIISCLLITSVVLADVSNGDRRMLFAYVVLLFFTIFRKGTNGNLVTFLVSKKGLYSLSIFALLILSYAVRAAGTDKMEYLSYGLLNGTIGGLGVGKILAYVKYYTAETTGYLMGETFLNYFIGLIIPSFMIYLFGGDEFYLRSSYLFDELFNTNKNMGYDFMMVADFYWNFSYFGYLLYGLTTMLILNFVVKYEQSNNELKYGLSVILTAFFIAGQRSDFGFFLKSFCYCALTYYVVYICATKKLKN